MEHETSSLPPCPVGWEALSPSEARVGFCEKCGSCAVKSDKGHPRAARRAAAPLRAGPRARHVVVDVRQGTNVFLCALCIRGRQKKVYNRILERSSLTSSSAPGTLPPTYVHAACTSMHHPCWYLT